MEEVEEAGRRGGSSKEKKNVLGWEAEVAGRRGGEDRGSADWFSVEVAELAGGGVSREGGGVEHIGGGVCVCACKMHMCVNVVDFAFVAPPVWTAERIAGG